MTLQSYHLDISFCVNTKKLLQGQMPTKSSTTNQPFSVPLEPSSQQNPTMVSCKEYIVILKGLSVWQYNTKITKFDLFNLSQTVINIAILVTRVLLLVTPPVTRVIFYFFLFLGERGWGTMYFYLNQERELFILRNPTRHVLSSQR